MSDPLTGRQRQVAGLVAAGLTNREVAEQLGISRDGVKYHVSEILSRLGVSSRDSVREALWGPADGEAQPNETGRTAAQPGEVDFAKHLLDAMRGSLLQRVLRIATETGVIPALRALPPARASRIAAAADIDVRYARSILSALAAHQVVDYRAATQQFRLSPPHRSLLTPERPDSFLELIDSTTPRDPDDDLLIAQIRHDQGIRLEAGMANEWANLIHILPRPAHGLAAAFSAAPQLAQSLEQGISVGEAGSGRGRLLIELARTYPHSRFSGYDLNPTAVELATADADHAGVANCEFIVADITQHPVQHNLMLAFGMLHDTPNPAKIVAAIARIIAPQGLFIATEIAASSRLERNLGLPLIEVMYDLSLMHCVPHSVASGGEGLGALWGQEATRALLEAAGLSVQIVRSESDAFHNYFIATPQAGIGPADPSGAVRRTGSGGQKGAS
ncbi:MAG: DNA-binding response regulator, NarL/FixJ family [Chloroflexi bacterium]|nr:MAG: DNA-binding response regulator, NarL/FixJ family [Chloroflexota bacterium]